MMEDSVTEDLQQSKSDNTLECVEDRKHWKCTSMQLNRR